MTKQPHTKHRFSVTGGALLLSLFIAVSVYGAFNVGSILLTKGSVKLTERSTAPTGVDAKAAGASVLYVDSASHKAQLSNNNGSFGELLASNSAPTITGNWTWNANLIVASPNIFASKGLANFGPNGAATANDIVSVGTDDIAQVDISSATGAAVLHGLNIVPTFQIDNSAGNKTHASHTSLPVKKATKAASGGFTATVTNSNNIYVHAQTKDATATVTNVYGIYLENQTIGATINEAIHSEGKVNFNAGATIAGGSGLTVTANGAALTGGTNITDGNLQLNTGQIQSFTLVITTTGGSVVQHAILGDPISGGASNYAGKITGASSTAANTPQVAAGVDFTNGVGVDAGNTHEIVFNTAAQTSADTIGTAHVASTDAGTALNVMLGTTSINVNGTTRRRTVLFFTNAATGANYAITGANIGASKTIRVQLEMWIK